MAVACELLHGRPAGAAREALRDEEVPQVVEPRVRQIRPFESSVERLP
jgi:hypothetical protein